MLERGLRHPTPDVIGKLSERLALSHNLVASWANPQLQEDGVYASHLTTVLDFISYSDPESTTVATRTLLDVAALSSNEHMSWIAHYVHASTLIQSGQVQEGITTALALSRLAITSENINLRVRTARLVSSAALAVENFKLAASASLEAVSLLSEADDHQQLNVETLLSALLCVNFRGNSGGEGASYRSRLGTALDRITSRQLQCRVAWALGSFDLEQGRITSGLQLHQLASGYITPARDVTLWTDFHIAAAGDRLRCGLADATVLAFINKAMTGHRVTNRPSDGITITLHKATYLQMNGRWAEALEISESDLKRLALLPTDKHREQYLAVMKSCRRRLGRSSSIPSKSPRSTHLLRANTGGGICRNGLMGPLHHWMRSLTPGRTYGAPRSESAPQASLMARQFHSAPRALHRNSIEGSSAGRFLPSAAPLADQVSALPARILSPRDPMKH